MTLQDIVWQLREASRMFSRRIFFAKNGFYTYNGTEEKIATQIIKDCWNGTFFQVSSGHFSLFYIRDFGMCVEALQKLGYKSEIEKTLQFALTCYTRKKRITTTITKEGKCFDVFSYAPDSLAFLLYSLRIAKSKNKYSELALIYKPFLEEQVQFFENNIFDKNTNLIRADKNFSSIKDNAKRQSSCYDNCCAAVIAREAKSLKLHCSLSFEHIKKEIKKTFWNGEYFKDTKNTKDRKDTKKTDYVAGDANTFPFWFDIFSEKNPREKEMLKKAVAIIQKENLDAPFPLKYTSFVPNNFFFPLHLLAPNYEGNTIWAHMGLCYINILMRIDKKLANRHLEEYKKKINLHKTFLELYNANSNPYKSIFYVTDEAMLWVSIWLALKNRV